MTTIQTSTGNLYRSDTPIEELKLIMNDPSITAIKAVLESGMVTGQERNDLVYLNKNLIEIFY